MKGEYIYTEISGKQSGKTSRLLAQMAKDYHLDPEGRLIVIVKTQEDKKKLLHYLLSGLGRLLDDSSSKINSRITIHTFEYSRPLEGLAKNCRVYLDNYDEVDYDKGDIMELRFNMKWAKSIYSTTTPCFVRTGGSNPSPMDDLIFTFLDLSDGLFSNYKNHSLINKLENQSTPSQVLLTDGYGVFLN